MPPLLLSTLAIVAATQPQPQAGPTDPIRYEVFDLGAVSGGKSRPTTASASQSGPEHVVAGTAEERSNAESSGAYAWVYSGGVTARITLPLPAGSKRSLPPSIQDIGPGGQVLLTSEARLFLWDSGLLTQLDVPVPPGRPFRASGFYAHFTRAGAIYGSASPGHGATTAWARRDGSFEWLGVTGPGFQTPQGSHYSIAVGHRPDGSIVGYSGAYSANPDAAGPKEPDGGWSGYVGWIWRDGKTTRLTPVQNDDRGRPLCKPELVLPDGRIVVRIPSGYGTAQADAVKPVVFKGIFDRQAELSIFGASPDGNHVLVLAGRASGDRGGPKTAWIMDAASGLEVRRPAVKDVAGELEGLSPVRVLNGGGVLFWSSRGKPAEPANSAEILWLWKDGKSSPLLPPGVAPKDYRGVLLRTGYIVRHPGGNMYVPAPAPKPGRKPETRTRAWFYSERDDHVYTPDFGAANPAADWDSELLVLDSLGGAFLKCTDRSNPERSGCYYWSPASGFRRLRFQSGDNGNECNPEIARVMMIPGDDGKLLVAYPESSAKGRSPASQAGLLLVRQ